MLHPNQRDYSRKVLNNIRDYLEGRSWVGEVEDWWNDVEVKGSHLIYNHMGKEYQIVPREEQEKLLMSIMEDPTQLATSVERLYNRVKDKYIGVSFRDCKSFLYRLESYQIRKKFSKPVSSSPIITLQKNEWHQIDLIDITPLAHWNGGNHFILTGIDIFTRKFYAVPIYRKEGPIVANALKDLYKNPEDRPKKLQSDNGLEFKNTDVNKVLKEYKIKRVYSKPHTPTTQSTIEKSNGYLKSILYSYLQLHDTRRYIDVLPQLVQNFNTNYSKRIKTNPEELSRASKDSDLVKRARNINIKYGSSIRHAPPLNLRDQVRIAFKATQAYKKNPLQKVAEKWSKEIYLVTKILPKSEWGNQRYMVSDGETYSGFELQKVDPTNMLRLKEKPIPKPIAPRPKPVAPVAPAEPRRGARDKRASVRLQDYLQY